MRAGLGLAVAVVVGACAAPVPPPPPMPAPGSVGSVSPGPGWVLGGWDNTAAQWVYAPGVVWTGPMQATAKMLVNNERIAAMQAGKPLSFVVMVDVDCASEQFRMQRDVSYYSDYNTSGVLVSRQRLAVVPVETGVVPGSMTAGTFRAVCNLMPARMRPAV